MTWASRVWHWSCWHKDDDARAVAQIDEMVNGHACHICGSTPTVTTATAIYCSAVHAWQ